jgi:hypothetical protein
MIFRRLCVQPTQPGPGVGVEPVVAVAVARGRVVAVAVADGADVAVGVAVGRAVAVGVAPPLHEPWLDQSDGAFGGSQPP